MRPLSMIRRFAAFTLVLALGMMELAGCSAGQEDNGQTDSSKSRGYSPVRIGTMPTEDFLPMWVAEKDGLFAENGVDVENISFDSAQTLSAAIAAGEVDMAMVDVMRAIKLNESGTPVDIEWVTLGAESSQGVFGVLAPADAPYSTLAEFAAAVEAGDPLALKGVGLASNTVPEYVFEMLCEQQGIDPSLIPVVEVASLPERYSLLASDNLGAAALPASLLDLGVASGMILLADDSQGDNISQSVMVARSAFAAEDPDALSKIADAWDEAVGMIDENPFAYIPLLAEKANLNGSVIDSYEVSEYPLAVEGGSLVRIDPSLVTPQIEWMLQKGYLSSDVVYDASTGAFTVH